MDELLKNRDSAKVYSVPRRYDLATIFVISLAFGLLFAGMRAMRWPPEVALLTGLFVSFVGLAQAILFKGSRPRLASVLAGIVFWLGCALIMGVWTGGLYGLSLFAIFQGTILGYFAGTLIGGVFLLADVLRRGLRKLHGR
jgi:hypothetical protein